MEESNKKCNLPVDCNDWWSYLETHDALYQPSICCTMLCCPIKFPINLIFCGPCTVYNIICNKCYHTDKKNYLC